MLKIISQEFSSYLEAYEYLVKDYNIIPEEMFLSSLQPCGCFTKDFSKVHAGTHRDVRECIMDSRSKVIAYVIHYTDEWGGRSMARMIDFDSLINFNTSIGRDKIEPSMIIPPESGK